MSAPEIAHARHRRCIVLRGDPATTRQRALALAADIPPAARLWIDAAPDPEAEALPPHAARRLLGRAFDLVVLDLHRGVDADLLGLVHGFVWGGGSLLLRMPPAGQLPAGDPLGLAVHPFTPADVAARFWRRFEAHLLASPACEPPPARPLAPALHIDHGSDEQARIVDALLRELRAPDPRVVVLLADRGRGKSSALGLALARLLAAPGRAGAPPIHAAITAASPDSVAEVFRFALGAPAVITDPAAPLRFIPLAELAVAHSPLTHLFIDEAAQLPVPLLQRLALRHPAARIALATTARGYEGTGRGFVLRFLAWARDQPRPLTELTLHAPIRWAPEDPLERLVFDLLALDAEPARLDLTAPDPTEPPPLPTEPPPLDRDLLRDRHERVALGVDSRVGASMGRQRRGSPATVGWAPPEEGRSSTDLASSTDPLAAHARSRRGGAAPARDPSPPPP